MPPALRWARGEKGQLFTILVAVEVGFSLLGFISRLARGWRPRELRSIPLLPVPEETTLSCVCAARPLEGSRETQTTLAYDVTEQWQAPGYGKIWALEPDTLAVCSGASWVKNFS